MNDLQVSAVVLSFNRREELAYSLGRLQEVTGVSLEIIVVDNGSKDGSAEMVAAEFPRVRLLALPENIGVAAYNRGFFQARGQFILILDDDSFPAPDALEKMVELFNADPDIGLVAFDVRSFDHYDRKSEQKEPLSLETAPPSYLLGFNGAGAGVRKEILDQVGGYPEEFFLYWNEQDLAMRILAAGRRIAYSAAIVAYHRYAPKNRDSRRGPFFYTRNLFWIFWKHLPWPDLVRRSLRLGLLCCYHSLAQLTTVYLQALAAALFRAPDIFRRRRALKPELARRFRIPMGLSFILFR